MDGFYDLEGEGQRWWLGPWFCLFVFFFFFLWWFVVATVVVVAGGAMAGF